MSFFRYHHLKHDRRKTWMVARLELSSINDTHCTHSIGNYLGYDLGNGLVIPNITQNYLITERHIKLLQLLLRVVTHTYNHCTQGSAYYT